MADLKQRRQRAMAELIQNNALASQDELAARLGALGFSVTQATISRDLEQIGAVKVRRDGIPTYALPEAMRESPAFRLSSVLRDWVRSTDTAGNLVVLKTPPGSAHLVGVALDQSDFTEIVGTICGDDTIFVACRTMSDCETLTAKLRAAPGAELQ